MRIVIVSTLFPPRAGGGAVMASSLAGRYAAAGHEVLVLAAGQRSAPRKEDRDGYRIVRLPAVTVRRSGPPIGIPATFTVVRPGNPYRVNRALRDFQPDVLHLHGQLFDLSWLAARYARRHGLPVLLSVHTPAGVGMLRSLFFRLLDAMLVKPILKRLTLRCVIGDKHGMDYCARRYAIGKDDSEYVPIAVDAARFDQPPVRNIRAEQAIGNAPLIVSLGDVTPERDRLPLVEAMPEILAAYPRTRVLVVGRVYHDAFAERAVELGVRHAFLVRGAVPEHVVPSCFAAADIVAQDLNGGCGRPSLEAMASRTPTIVSIAEDNFPGIALRHGVNALLVPPNDPVAVATTVIALLDDPGRAAAIARQQSELVRHHFSLDVVADEHLRALEKLVADADRQAPGR